MAGILKEGPIRKALRERKPLKRSPEEREPGSNSVDINAYVSKIRFNLARKTIDVYGKDGKLIWGVIDQYAVRP